MSAFSRLEQTPSVIAVTVERTCRPCSHPMLISAPEVPAVDGWFCPDCGEIEFVGAGEGKRYSAAIAAHIAAILDILYNNIVQVEARCHDH